MTSNTHARPIELMFRHLPVLRDYASRMILKEQELTDVEEQDRVERLAQFLTIGSSLNWTEKETVSLLLREVFAGS